MPATNSERLRKLDELIAEAKKLGDPSKVTLTGQLEDLRNAARYCLADADPWGREALREVSSLEFKLPANPTEREQTECYQKLHLLTKLLEGVRDAIEKGQGSGAGGTHARVPPFPIPAGAAWEDVSIRFLSDHRVEVAARGHVETRNYSEMGFEDHRTGNPNKAWELLRSMAEQGGLLRGPKLGRERSKVEKTVQELRKSLRHLFQLGGDPVEFSRKDGGYKARFRVESTKSYEH
jgi:hypothetical protein